jgi:hypothetical protein
LMPLFPIHLVLVARTVLYFLKKSTLKSVRFFDGQYLNN